MKTLISWNVNGIRAVEKKGFFDWMKQSGADVIALQETKAQPEQLTKSFVEPDGYHACWSSAVKKGYSGVCVYSKSEPRNVSYLGIGEFDDEGRTLILEYKDFTLINCYFPNSQDGGARLDYKLRFCDAVMDKALELEKSGKNVAICGDYNIAHTPIDLAHPKANENNPGYLPEERAWMDKFIAAGFIDTFRIFNKEGGNYSWWSYRMNAREKNVGWRIDYFCVNPAWKHKIKEANILADVMGSDHCPVSLVFA
ncbi:MAG: exodeoxyribonuclease III [Spirochaetales bacterium]|nr:exodeoxyribonuclease III [Spirochaetales bacterium]